MDNISISQRPLANYRFAHDKDDNGRIGRDEEIDVVELGSDKLSGKELEGLYVREKGWFNSWRPAGRHFDGSSRSPIGVFTFYSEVAAIDPQAGTIDFKQGRTLHR